MTEEAKKVYNVLRHYWRLAKDRRYKFFPKDGYLWLSSSMDNMIKYCALPRETVLAGLDALKADSHIDYCLDDYDNREYLSFTNNW